MFQIKFEQFERSRLKRQSLQPMTLREKELARQLEECQEALAQSRRENALLRQKIDLLVRRVFGSSSERLDRAQLELLLQLPASSDSRSPGGRPEPLHALHRVHARNARRVCRRTCRWWKK